MHEAGADSFWRHPQSLGSGNWNYSRAQNGFQRS